MSKDQNTLVLERRLTVTLLVAGVAGLFLLWMWWFSAAVSFTPNCSEEV